MIFYFIGRATDDKGNDISESPESVYGYTLDRNVAKLVLDLLRTHQTAERTTYVPGTIGAPNDRAWQAERAARMNVPSVSTDVPSEVSAILDLIDIKGG